jgi:hypothetical protein
MKKIILIFSLTFASFINLYAQWARTYGGNSIDNTNSIQQTNDGGYIAAGETASFGAGGGDVWILKLTSAGTIEWQRTYGGIDRDWATTIQQTRDGGYIVAAETYSFGAGGLDLWILKLSSTGTIEWQRTYGGSSDEYASFIQQTRDGGYIVAAHSFGPYSSHLLISKLSSTGAIEWQRIYWRYGGPDYAWEIQQTSDGGYIVAAQSWSLSAKQYDAWILKLTSTGDIEWQRTYGGTDRDRAQVCLPISDGGYIVTGWTRSFGAGQDDAWILKLTSTGDIEWQRTYGGSDTDHAEYPYIQYENGIKYIVTGSTCSFGTGKSDAWILKLCSDGDIDSSCGFAGTSEATITYPNASPQDTDSYSISALFAIPQDTHVSPQDSDATVYLICPAQKYTLTISASEGGTTDPAPGPYSLDGGKRVTVTAQPDSGHRFSGWSGDVLGSENPITVVMDKDKSITANFIREYTLTIAAGKGGTTNPSPGSYAYGVGTEVSITATPEPDYRFSGWTGDALQGHENDNPLVLSIDKDKSITANFVRPYKLTITAGKGGTSEPAPGTYTYDSGTVVIIRAIPDSGYQFSGWSVDASGKENPITVTIDKDKWIVAAFAPLDEKEKAWDLNCFIATAAYGSPLHPHVEILRNFRDRYLMPRKLGRILVRIYYRHSPFIAKIVKKYRALRLVVRISLLPMIAFSYSMLHFSPIVIGIIFAFIFTLPIFFVCFYRRRMKNSQVFLDPFC